MILFLLACSPEPASAYNPWTRVSPPPGHGEVECWVWSDGFLDQAYGGPACFALPVKPAIPVAPVVPPVSP